MTINTKKLKLEQAVIMTVERARLALNLAASSDRETTVVLKYEDGRITFSVKLDG